MKDYTNEQLNIMVAEECGVHICPNCNHQIQPDVCHCGDKINYGKNGCPAWHESHSPVPIGCVCGYEDCESRKLKNPACIPFTTSLDACATYEDAMLHREKVIYHNFLVLECGTHGIVFANPKQRVLAFLKVRGRI